MSHGPAGPGSIRGDAREARVRGDLTAQTVLAFDADRGASTRTGLGCGTRIQVAPAPGLRGFLKGRRSAGAEEPGPAGPERRAGIGGGLVRCLAAEDVSAPTRSTRAGSRLVGGAGDGGARAQRRRGFGRCRRLGRRLGRGRARGRGFGRVRRRVAARGHGQPGGQQARHEARCEGHGHGRWSSVRGGEARRLAVLEG